MVTVSIQGDMKEAATALKRVAENLRKKIVVRALRKTTAQAKTETRKAIKDEYKISSRVIGKSITTKTVPSTPPHAEISVQGGPLPMYALNAKQQKAGVRVKIKGRTIVVPHAFIATMRSGHTGVFARGSYKGAVDPTGTFGNFTFGKPRLPVGELRTFSLPQGFGSKTVMTRVILKFQAKYPQVLFHEVEWELSKNGFR